ncbi:MAG: cupin domain-containing protein [Candidatus Bathyarchaeia archaeon]
MRVAHGDLSKARDARGAHGGAGILRYMSLYDKSAFETPWLFVHWGVLRPGGGIGYHAHNGCEEMFAIFSNKARFKHNGNTAELWGRVCVPCRMGEAHGIYNPTSEDAYWMNFCVAGPSGNYDCKDFNDDVVNSPLGPVDRLPTGWFSRPAMVSAPSVHGGRGTLLFRRIWGPDDFKTSWSFIDHAVIPPGCSIGYHTHRGIEECYVILNGRGRMTVDGETREVGQWDAVLNALGGSHGIYNHTGQDLEILNMAVAKERGKLDSEDLGDDLSGC